MLLSCTGIPHQLFFMLAGLTEADESVIREALFSMVAQVFMVKDMRALRLHMSGPYVPQHVLNDWRGAVDFSILATQSACGGLGAVCTFFSNQRLKSQLPPHEEGTPLAWRVRVNGQGERTVEATEGMFEILEVRTPEHVEKKNGLRYIFNSAIGQLKKLHGDNWCCLLYTSDAADE